MIKLTTSNPNLDLFLSKIMTKADTEFRIFYAFHVSKNIYNVGAIWSVQIKIFVGAHLQ